MMCKMTLNDVKNGIELRFDSKPSEDVLAQLSEHGFKWSFKQSMWYAKQSQDRIDFAGKLCNELTRSNNTVNVCKVFDLWESTRTESIGINKSEGKSVKDIAAEVRVHLKRRFPMCKLSIRCSDSCIDVSILSSPFAKESDELDAINNYCQEYVESYKYCTCYDPYGDYGSSFNFYGGKRYNCVPYNYEQSQELVSTTNIIELFQKRKAEYEESERVRFADEMQKRIEEDRIRKAEYEKQEEIRKRNHELVEKNVSVVTVNYFVEDTISPKSSKQDSLLEYTKNLNADNKQVCRVTKEARMDKQIYDLFITQLLDEWSFIQGTGGSETQDARIQSMIDYEQMDANERKSVEWYCNECVAIRCEDELMFVVDAQGYDYCRYVYLIDKDSKITDRHNSTYVIDDSKLAYYKLQAQLFEGVSNRLIDDNDIASSWSGENFELYLSLFEEWLGKNQSTILSIPIIQAIDGDKSEFKRAMYKVFRDYYGVQNQFKRAGLTRGQRITIVKISDIGGIFSENVTFEKLTCTSYAQYNNAVLIEFKPRNKSNVSGLWIYGDVLIYNGWVNSIPDNLLWDVINESGSVITKKCKYSSFDHEQYDVAIDYYKSIGAQILVNTYKP